MPKAKKIKQPIELTGMYEVLNAVEDLIRAAEPAQQAALARVISAYADDFPDEYFWATGATAPALLQNLMFAITPYVCRDCAAKSESSAISAPH